MIEDIAQEGGRWRDCQGSGAKYAALPRHQADAGGWVFVRRVCLGAWDRTNSTIDV